MQQARRDTGEAGQIKLSCEVFIMELGLSKDSPIHEIELTAGVVEHSEYEFIRHQLVENMDRVAELDKINTDLRSKIDKAIEEIEERKKCLHTDIYNIESIEFGKGLELALKILKENIGK